ncbi:MAG: protein kinase, partial [Lachnospiraceae bacterium]|nr:protein kinase [Lachnospiraceae bacterium]
MIGRMINDYVVEQKIGEGSFGTIYKVSKSNVVGKYVRAMEHVRIPDAKQYKAALNSFGGDVSQTDEYFKDMLVNITHEIDALAALSDECPKYIVRYDRDYKVEDSTEEGFRHYDIFLFMEYLTPLQDYLLDNEVKVKDAVRLGKDILTALIACHDKDVIHKEIQDDSIFVTPDKTFKLGCFGVSRTSKNRSKAASVQYGTAFFTAPDVYSNGGEEYDKSADIYSLGMVLYRLLNHRRLPFLPPYPEKYGAQAENAALEKIMRFDTPNLPHDATNELGKVAVRAIASKDERYASARDFLADLEEAEKQLSPEEEERVVSVVVAGRSLPNEGATVHQPVPPTSGGNGGGDISPMGADMRGSLNGKTTGTVFIQADQGDAAPRTVLIKPIGSSSGSDDGAESRNGAMGIPPKRKWPLILVILLLLAVAGLGVYHLLNKGNGDISRAEAYVEKGKYELAIDIYEESGLTDKAKETKYMWAEALEDQEKYDDAYALFEDLNEQSHIDRSKYKRAQKHIEQGEYELAKQLLEDLKPDYGKTPVSDLMALCDAKIEEANKQVTPIAEPTITVPPAVTTAAPPVTTAVPPVTTAAPTVPPATPTPHVFLTEQNSDEMLTKVELKEKDTIDLKFKGVTDWNQEKYECVWESSDTSVASVNNSNGIVTAIKAGE